MSDVRADGSRTNRWVMVSTEPAPAEPCAWVVLRTSLRVGIDGYVRARVDPMLVTDSRALAESAGRAAGAAMEDDTDVCVLIARKPLRGVDRVAHGEAVVVYTIDEMGPTEHRVTGVCVVPDFAHALALFLDVPGHYAARCPMREGTCN